MSVYSCHLASLGHRRALLTLVEWHQGAPEGAHAASLLQVQWPNLPATLRATLASQYHAPASQTLTLLFNATNFRTCSGCLVQEFSGKWIVEPDPKVRDGRSLGATRLRYEISVVPKWPIPNSVVSHLVKAGLPANITAIAERAEEVCATPQRFPSALCCAHSFALLDACTDCNGPTYMDVMGLVQGVLPVSQGLHTFASPGFGTAVRRIQTGADSVQMARKRMEAPRFIAGSLSDDAVLGRLPDLGRRDLRGEVLPAKGPARAPWPTLSLQVSHPPALLGASSWYPSLITITLLCKFSGHARRAACGACHRPLGGAYCSMQSFNVLWTGTEQ